MGKVAKLIGVSLLTRVIIDEDQSIEEVYELARKQFIDKLYNEGVSEHCDQFEDDTECPYGSITTDLIGEKEYPVTVSTIRNICGWGEYAELTGANEWAVSEGRVDDNDVILVKETHARELGLIK